VIELAPSRNVAISVGVTKATLAAPAWRCLQKGVKAAVGF
jgi:hypothetical protein